MSREGRGLPADLFWPCGACWPASPQSFQSTATLPFSSPHCALRQKPVQPSVVWTLPTTRTRGFLLGWPDSRIKRGSFRPTTSLPYPCSSPCQVDIASGWKAPSLPGSCEAVFPPCVRQNSLLFALGPPGILLCFAAGACVALSTEACLIHLCAQAIFSYTKNGRQLCCMSCLAVK